MTHNHDRFEQRLTFARQLLNENFKDIGESVITPLDYDANSIFKYNNFIYRIDLPSPLNGSQLAGREARKSCNPIPIGTQRFVLRIANDLVESMYARSRTENEVAMLLLTAAAVKGTRHEHIVPEVYAWGTVATGSPFGWILQQWMPGMTLEKYLEKSPDGVIPQEIFTQMAEVVHALQSYELPHSITGYGGVTFDDQENIISGPMTTVGEGPWSTYEESFAAWLRLALQEADKNEYIQGWRANGVRERLERFVADGVPTQFARLTSKSEKCVVHADFAPTNVLVNDITGNLTGLIDYDNSCILHPSYEFTKSFSGIGESFSGWSADESSEDAQLRHAKLHGFPEPLPSNNEDGPNWSNAKLWEEELERLNVKRLRTTPGMDGVALVDEVLGSILPWRLSNEDIVREQSEPVKLKFRAECELQLQALLEHFGY